MHKPPVGDPSRQAIDSLLGYDYQIWRTVEAWLRLPQGNTLYVECAEDYDVVNDSGIVANQIKHSPANITLNSQDVRDAIANFWALRCRNPDRGRISMRFLTRGAIGKEKSSKLGDEKGLELWKRAAEDDVSASELVKNHLIECGGRSDFIRFLQESSPDSLQHQLFSRIEWAAEEPSFEATQLSVSRLAINLGNQRRISPSISRRAVPALLEYCKQAATQPEPALRSLTIEDAHLCFESNTTLPIPIDSRLISALGGGTESTMAFSAASFDGEFPGLPIDGLPRSEFLGELIQLLQANGCLLIVGSEGEGKSTSANMLARKLGPGSYWMDLRGGDEQIAIAAIENALVLARSAPAHIAIILDDLPAAQGVSDAIWGRLAVLISAARHARVALVMTSRGVPTDNVDPRFRASGIPVASVPRITASEMVQYFLGLGCPEATRATSWVKLILAHSGNGHPKLVHLAALELRDNGWKGVTVESILTPPRSIDEARAHARQTACKVISQPDRDLLFTLSLHLSAFDRSLVIDIGSKLGLPEPGASFDRLVGRWLEPHGSAGYKVTPLLNSQAKELWSTDRLSSMHGVIFDAHIERGTLRVDQAMDLFLHAFSAQDPHRFGIFVHITLSALNTTPGLAMTLEFLTAVGDQQDSFAIAFDERCSILFRFLQIQIARIQRPEAIANIAQRWLWEVEHASDRSMENLWRGTWGATVASCSEPSIPATTLALALQSAARIESLDLGGATELTTEPDGVSNDAMQLLFLVAQSNIETISAATEFLGALEKFEPSLRTRLLDSFKQPLAHDGCSMFERVFVSLLKAPQDSAWQEFTAILHRAVELSSAWGTTAFGAIAARVLSIVYDEHLDNRVAATAVLEGFATGDGASISNDQLANIAFRSEDYATALVLWEKSLRGGLQSDFHAIRNPYAMCKAAITASQLGDMRRAAYWFEQAAETVSTQVVSFPSSQFLIDASYCWLMAGEGERGLRLAAIVRDELKALDADSQSPQLFANQKMLGQLLMLFLTNLEGGESERMFFVGATSNPDLDTHRLLELPPTPIDIIDMALVELARLIGIEKPWLTPIEQDLAQTKYPYIAFQYRAAKLRRLISRGTFSCCAEEIYHLNEAYLQLRMLALRQEEDFKEFVESPPESDWADDPQLMVSCLQQVLSLAAMQGGNVDDLVSTWCRKLNSAPHGSHVITQIRLVASAFGGTSSHAIDIARSSSDSTLRVGSAATVLARNERGALETAQCQAVLIFELLNHPASRVVCPPLEAFCELFAQQWLPLLNSPALLSVPRISVPMLRAAIQSQVPSSQKLIQILKAAEVASGRSLPAVIFTSLYEISDIECRSATRLAAFRN
ncbi:MULTISPECIES: hypothetical protein [Pseudomonadaceae]|uniref:AAA+ ATPase domain-containing protein n=1 Tax=Aquipseudomonas alcaligenes TaxID=43263 RepID=A0AB73HYC5_AQUAC|nr:MULTISPECIES: hypothetical protein [Pseudomonas]MCB2250811.1 hypothetical protein [Pseudomonas chlororaphis]MDH0142822.1 hypothetical protein [Pseudomonas alcaligenes]